MLFGYFLGPFGALLASGIFTSFLQRYWTDVLFANYRVVGADGKLALPSGSPIGLFLTLLPLLSAILIVVGNLVAGQLIERTKSKAGKARPWILLSSVLLGVACVLMFVLPMGNGIETPVLTMVFTAIAYNLYYSICYPLYNTANSTLIPVSTRNSNQRGLLASFANFAGVGVMGAGGMVFPMIIAWFMGGWEAPNKNAWMVAFIIIGIFTFVMILLQYYFTRERVTEEALKSGTSAATEKIPIKKQLKAVATEKYWWMIIIFYLVFQFSGAFKNLSITYFCTDHFSGTAIGGADGSGAMSIINILGAIPMAAAMAFIWILSAKFGKRIVCLIGCAIAAGGGVIAGIWSDNFYVVCVGVALKSFGSAPACYMILALIADVLDHIEAKNGYRCDGFTMSIYSSLMAASTPVAQGIFNAISNGGANETANTISYIWIETIAYAVCTVIMVFFIVEKYLKADRKITLERQKANAAAAGVAWIDPDERLRLEQEEADRVAEQARIDELKAKCEKSGLDFEAEEGKYQAALAEKQEAKRVKDEAAKAKREEAARIKEENRVAALKAKCEKEGLNYEDEEQKRLDAIAAKQEAKKQKEEQLEADYRKYLADRGVKFGESLNETSEAVADKHAATVEATEPDVETEAETARTEQTEE
ncbi:MAG: MFS transporter [Clostridiales bacterium]|nr:MFS transporter [Clostridiales bacterium]